MGCKRCHGMVIVDPLLDGSLDERMSGFDGWCCINCGEWLDIGVRRSRAASRSRWRMPGGQLRLPVHYQVTVRL